jgi:hypothetical protein
MAKRSPKRQAVSMAASETTASLPLRRRRPDQEPGGKPADGPIAHRGIEDEQKRDQEHTVGREDSNSQMSFPKLAVEVWPEFPFHFGTFSRSETFPG